MSPDLKRITVKSPPGEAQSVVHTIKIFDGGGAADLTAMRQLDAQAENRSIDQAAKALGVSSVEIRMRLDNGETVSY